MRVAVFTDTFPALSETFIARQIAGLTELGHNVHVYAGQKPHHAATTGGVKALPRTTYMEMPPASGYWEMPVFPPWGRTWLPGAARAVPNAKRLLDALPLFVRCLAHAPLVTAKVLDPAEYGYAARSLSTLYRVEALLGARGHFDLAHAHFGPVANNVRFVRELWHVPLVVSFHGYDVSAWPREKGDGVYRRLFRVADIVTANSNYTRKRLEALGCPPRKIRLLHMGVDLGHFSFRERSRPGGRRTETGRIEILSVGRLVEKKGFEFAIRAVAKVREKHPGIHYSIVGDGPLRAHLQMVAHELELEDVVTFHGPKPVADGEFVGQKMGEAHIFVAPSVTASDSDVEGQGLVLQEAQACGLPVLATDHNGFPEGMVSGRSGFLVPERDVDGLAEKLAYMIEDDGKWAEWGRAGRKHVEEQYDIRKLNRQLEGIYEQAILHYRAKRRHR
jgi:colanic acid/amylovoran biosynthesis glycosyltransferase